MNGKAIAMSLTLAIAGAGVGFLAGSAVPPESGSSSSGASGEAAEITRLRQRIAALAQLRPEDVPVFFAEAERIAKELASEPVGEDEYNRVVEPLRQYVSRASTGNLFWLYQLEGATVDSRRVPMLRYLLADYTQTPPAELQALAQKVEYWAKKCTDKTVKVVKLFYD